MTFFLSILAHSALADPVVVHLSPGRNIKRQIKKHKHTNFYFCRFYLSGLCIQFACNTPNKESLTQSHSMHRQRERGSKNTKLRRKNTHTQKKYRKYYKVFAHSIRNKIVLCVFDEETEKEWKKEKMLRDKHEKRIVGFSVSLAHSFQLLRLFVLWIIRWPYPIFKTSVVQAISIYSSLYFYFLLSFVRCFSCMCVHTWNSIASKFHRLLWWIAKIE